MLIIFAVSVLKSPYDCKRLDVIMNSFYAFLRFASRGITRVELIPSFTFLCKVAFLLAVK